MEYVVQRDELVRCMDALRFPEAQRFHPFGDAMVEFRKGAHGVKDAVPGLEHAGQDIVDIVDRKRIVRIEILDRAFRSGSGSVPEFLSAVAVPDEQYVLAVITPGRQYGNCVRLREARQVVEITVLAVAVFDIAIPRLDRRARQDGDAVLAHHPHECFAALGKFLPVHRSLLMQRP